MKLLFLLILIVSGAAITMLHSNAMRILRERNDPSRISDAAFRDGLFLGRLDAGRGRRPHLASGRWNDDADRRSFVFAYLQGYREARGSAVSAQLTTDELIEQRAFDEGVADGLRQRLAAGPFHPLGTEHYLHAQEGSGQRNDALEQYRQAYREAYCNGYQQGYYAQVTPNDADRETTIEVPTR